MANVEDLDAVIESCQQAMREFGKGNPEHMKALYSHREDVTINTAIDSPARGWDEVALMMERSASNLSEGEIDAFETVTGSSPLSSPTSCGWSITGERSARATRSWTSP